MELDGEDEEHIYRSPLAQIGRWEGSHNLKEKIGRWHGGSRGLGELRAAIHEEGGGRGEYGARGWMGKNEPFFPTPCPKFVF
jgi:hypothetical protein